MSRLNHCLQILELPPNASWAEVRQAYRDMVKVWHPDRFSEESNLRPKAQEKLKQINLAYEFLEAHFDEKHEPLPSFQERYRDLTGQYFTPKTFAEKLAAARGMTDLAGDGYAAAQQFLGTMYYHGEIFNQSLEDAYFWWRKAAEQLHPSACYSLGCLYLNGYKSTQFESFLRKTIDWRTGNSQVEAYKWFNLAVTYGAGAKAGEAKDQAALSLSGKERNLARKKLLPSTRHIQRLLRNLFLVF